MKRIILFWIISLVCSMFFLSCDNDEDEISTAEGVRYYVKYEVRIRTQHTNTDKFITYTDDKGSQTIKISDWQTEVNWEGTYGPVDKNFTATLDCSTAEYDNTSIQARIYISREKEPFVIKAEGSNAPKKKRLLLGYKIDF